MTDLTTIAQALHRSVRLTGHPTEYQFSPQYKIILRPTPAGQLQLVTVIWCRQPSQEQQAALREAFGVPDDAVMTCDYQRGWGIMRWTWGEASWAVHQFTLFTLWDRNIDFKIRGMSLSEIVDFALAGDAHDRLGLICERGK